MAFYPLCKACRERHPETELCEPLFKAQFIKAGFMPHEAEEEWQRIQGDEESGE